MAAAGTTTPDRSAPWRAARPPALRDVYARATDADWTTGGVTDLRARAHSTWNVTGWARSQYANHATQRRGSNYRG